uniref:Putative ovule protein n=1 Tax=Solanum chacoense TaxID=4108 RepID=A0A0V0GY41_SOLCH
MIDNSISGRETWEIEEAIPIATEIENATIEQERINSTWVRQNIIKLGKMFGADFKGHEEEATELLMQIDACRQVRRMEPPTDIQKAKYKGANELKNLITFDVQFKDSVGRNKGKRNAQVEL